MKSERAFKNYFYTLMELKITKLRVCNEFALLHPFSFEYYYPRLRHSLQIFFDYKKYHGNNNFKYPNKEKFNFKIFLADFIKKKCLL